MRQIIDKPLWIGNARDARDLQSIHDHGIQAVVDLAAEEPPAVLSRDLVYCRFPLLDGSGNPAWLLRSAIESVTRLISSDVPLLVACSAGMSRSPVIVAAALATVNRQPMDECLTQILSDGPQQVSAPLVNDVQAHMDD